MPFSPEKFTLLRPVLFHLTARRNLRRITKSLLLESASVLMAHAGDRSAVRERRPEALILAKGERVIASLRDQRPLHKGNVELQGGWEFGDLVEALNSRVFFWPGSKTEPIVYGLRHFTRYRDEDAVVLCLDTSELFGINKEPSFCKYNSGSPRCTGGRGSPRGPNTFVAAAEAPFSAGQVVEVTFDRHAKIPSGALEVRPVNDFPIP